MLLYCFLILLGFFLLIKGADTLVNGAEEIAKKFNIPELVIGLTIVAFGTSMPEFMVSITSALDNHPDLSIGNIIGSNLVNLFIILGICSILKPLKFKKETRFFEIPFTILSTILLFFLATNNNTNFITQKEGLILIFFCFIFIFYNIIISKIKSSKDAPTNANSKTISIFDAALKIIIGIFGLKLGGDLVVDNSILIAKELFITEKLISLTIIAFSTSLPELITSIIATKNNDCDMAIGNVLGSQILNILFIVGFCASISPIQYSISYNFDLFLLLIGLFSLLGISLFNKKKSLNKFHGIIFVTSYTIYLFITISK